MIYPHLSAASHEELNMRETKPTPTLHSRILIVNNHQLVAEGLKQLLEPEFEIAGIVTNYVDMVGPALALRPDVILCNLSLSLLSVLQAAKRLTKVLPEVKIIYLSLDTDPLLATDAFDTGCASGFLLITCSASELTNAIRSVLNGKRYLSPSLKVTVERLCWEKRKGADEAIRLSEREREVLRTLIERQNMRAVASVLGITPRTVAFHKYQIMDRLGAKSFADMVKFAERNRLLTEAKSVRRVAV